MAQEVALGLKLDGSQADQSVSSLKKQLREAQNEVANLSDKFGATSKQAIEAAKSAAILKDKIGDAKALTDAFNPDAKFTALTKSLSGVAGGFSALQGSIALFGNESEELQKQLLKVQAAMAFSNGIQQVGESIDSFKQLGAVIKSQVVTAFSTLRTAIISTGVLALVAALGLLIANFDKVKETISNLFPGLATFGKFIGGLVQKVTDFVGVTSEASRTLEAIKKANDAANSSLESTIKILEAQGGKEEEVYEAKRKLIENERKDLETRLKTKDDLNKKESEQLAKLNTDLSVLDAAETARRNKVIADRNKEAERLAKEKEAADDARRAAEYQKEVDDQNKILKLISDRQKARLGGDTGTINQDELAKAAQLQRDAEDKADEEATNSRVNRQMQALSQIGTAVFDQLNSEVEGNKAKNKAVFESDQDTLNRKRALRDVEVQLFTEGSNAIISILGQQSAVSKGLALSQIGIDTALAISALVKNSESNPSNALTFGASGVIQFATGLVRILTNVAKAKQLLSSPSIPSASIGGISAPSIQPIQAPLTPTVSRNAIDQQTINDRGSAAGRQPTVIRAIAVTGQITSEQEAEQRLRRGARLG